jgi:serine protease inhibitor
VKLLLTLLVSTLAATPLFSAGSYSAPSAVNQLGLDLLQKLAKGNGNLCLSPYSIQSALAMTYAGSDGETRVEMAKVLHYPKSDPELSDSFVALRRSLDATVAKSEERAKKSQRIGAPSEPITFQVANGLFGQKGYDFRRSFLDLIKQSYGAAFEQLDFVKNAPEAARRINAWVEDQTHGRIRDLIPTGALDAQTRLVIANAVYLKAPWSEAFLPSATKLEPFQVGGGAQTDVPMMHRRDRLGYAKYDGFSAVTIPYNSDDLHFLVLLPDDANGLSALEAKINASMVADCAHLEKRDVILHMPKFKLQPPTVSLARELQSLGLKSAFDLPKGSANFDRLAPRKPNDYLFVSDVFHKTYLAVDEKGTEAAAATAVAMMTSTARIEPAKPVEVIVDRPFLFAIQHAPTGTCLFLGQVTDPR